MKNLIYKLFLVLIASGAVMSCEEERLIYDTPNGFVQLNTESEGTISEADESITTTVLLGDDTNENGVTVDFSVTSSDPSRYTVTPSSGTLTIPAGEFSADIVISPVDNFTVDGDLEVVITLEPSSDKPVGLGGEENEFVSRTITIIDDDCPIDIDAMVGTYTVDEQFTAGQNAPSGLSDFFEENYQVELSLAPNDPSGTKVVISNSEGFDSYFAEGTVMSFVTCNGEVSFDAGYPVVADFETFEFTESSYNVEDGVITVSGPLANFGDYEFVLTRIDSNDPDTDTNED